MRAIRLLVLSSAIMTSSAWGQDFCLELAKRDLFDRHAGNAFNAGYDQSHSAYCRRYQESKSSASNLSAGYETASLDFGNSDARATAEFVCSTAFNESIFEQKSSQISRVLSANAVEAIRACTSSSGLIATPKYQGDDVVVIDLKYLAGDGEVNPIRQITAPAKTIGAIECGGPLAEAPVGAVINNQVMTMTCSRIDAAAQEVEGLYGRSKVYPGGLVTIHTNAKSVTVNLPRKVEGTACSPQPVVFPEPNMANLCRGCLTYGSLITDTLSASNRGNADLRELTYAVEVPNCGDYKLVAKYAMRDSRPVKLSLDGKIVNTQVFGRTNASFTAPSEYVEVGLPLKAGQHVFSFQRQGPFPHVDSVMLMPF